MKTYKRIYILRRNKNLDLLVFFVIYYTFSICTHFKCTHLMDFDLKKRKEKERISQDPVQPSAINSPCQG